MQSYLIKASLISAITIAGLSATPVAAKNDDTLGKFLFGALSLMILSQAFSEKDDPSPKVRKPINHEQEPLTKNPKLLPKACKKKIRTYNRIIRIVSKKCLRTRYGFVDYLPRKCMLKLQKTNGHIIRVYKTRCLNHRGYQFIY